MKGIPNIGIKHDEKGVFSMIFMMVKCSTCSHIIHFTTENVNPFADANVEGETEYRIEIANLSY